MAFAIIDGELLFEIARFSVALKEIAEGGAALLDGGGEDAADGLVEGGEALCADAVGSAVRVDACEEEGFAGVDVTDPYHDMVIHDVELNGAFAIGTAGDKLRGGESFTEWLGAELAEERV